jgi:hypothetical protein
MILLQSSDERDLSQWQVKIDHVEEVQENPNSTSKYFVYIMHVQRVVRHPGRDVVINYVLMTRFRTFTDDRRGENLLGRGQVRRSSSLFGSATNHRVIPYSRRYQDFYLLEQKLTEFHGIFTDARLPTKRSVASAKNLDYLQSIIKDLEHFLRVKFRTKSS